MSRSRLPWGVEGSPSLSEFRREMDGLMNRLLGGDGWSDGGFAPRLNLAETDSHYEVTAELPGVKPEEVQVELQQNELWLRGEKKQESEEKGKTFHRVERRYGSFQHVIPLGGAVDAARVTAEFQHGVLKITLPKVEAAKPKRIEVKG